MNTNLVLQSFGRENEYRRAILTVLSYYAHTNLPLSETRTLLFTDAPDYFQHYLLGLPVDCVLLTPGKIREMRGSIDFLHRMKIAVIDEAFQMTEGNMLYADSDTFFTNDPTPVLDSVRPDKSFMHLAEYDFESMRHLELPAGKTFRDFLALIEAKEFSLAGGEKLKVTPQHVSWNAGVMMFHPEHSRFIPDVYSLTEQFYPPTLNHASEQYAFSVMLQEYTELQRCDSVIYHYWYRVKKQIVDLFLQEQMTMSWAKLPLHEKLNDVREWCNLLPDFFEQHILTIRDNAVQAFNSNEFAKGYSHAMKAVLKDPFDKSFIKDILYHTKRRLINK